LLSKIKRTAAILIGQKKCEKIAKFFLFLLTNAKKQNELFGKYRSFDIAAREGCYFLRMMAVGPY
jgi:hypothetical protein